MKKLSFILLGILLLFAINAVAQNKVVVIPLNSSKKLKNVIMVSPSGGDYTDPITALNSIDDATPDNKYLVVIGPGVYILESSLAMKPYVTIAGAGQEITTLKGSVSSSGGASAALILGASNATLRNLTIENIGNGNLSIGVYSNSNSELTLQDITVIATGSGNSQGIHNYTSSPKMINVKVTGSGTATSFGVNNWNSSPEMLFVSAFAYDGTSNQAIRNDQSSSPAMTNVIATASGGSNDVGIYISSSTPTTILRSTVEGTSNGIYSSGSTVRIIQSSVINGIAGTGTITCANSDNGVDKELDTSCAVIP